MMSQDECFCIFERGDYNDGKLPALKRVLVAGRDKVKAFKEKKIDRKSGNNVAPVPAPAPMNDREPQPLALAEKFTAFPFVFEKGFAMRLMDKFGTMQRQELFASVHHDADNAEGKQYEKEEEVDLPGDVTRALLPRIQQELESGVGAKLSSGVKGVATEVLTTAQQQVNDAIAQLKADLDKLQSVDETLRQLRASQAVTLSKLDTQNPLGALVFEPLSRFVSESALQLQPQLSALMPPPTSAAAVTDAGSDADTQQGSGASPGNVNEATAVKFKHAAGAVDWTGLI